MYRGGAAVVTWELRNCFCVWSGCSCICLVLGGAFQWSFFSMQETLFSRVTWKLAAPLPFWVWLLQTSCPSCTAFSMTFYAMKLPTEGVWMWFNCENFLVMSTPLIWTMKNIQNCKLWCCFSVHEVWSGDLSMDACTPHWVVELRGTLTYPIIWSFVLL